MTLLEKAKMVPAKHVREYPNPELLDVAVALLKGEITSGQAGSVIGSGNKKSNPQQAAWAILKAALAAGRIEIKEISNGK